MVEFAGLRLDLDSEVLWKAGRPLALRRKPFAILRYLVANPHRLVTHAELLEHVWHGTSVSESATRAQLHDLRQALGEGVIETVVGRGYRFTAELGAASRGDTHPITLVGRDRELAALRTVLADAQRGNRQICFVTGDPGIGKTALTDAFIDGLDDDVLVLRGASIEQHGTPEAYAPVIQMIAGLRDSPHRDSALAMLKKYAPAFLSELNHLFPGSGDTPHPREAKPLGELVEAFEALASRRMVVVVHEDVHWSDVATLDLIAALGARRGDTRLCWIGTARAVEAQTITNPLNRVLRSLVSRNLASTLVLDQIAEADVARYVELRYPGHKLPQDFTRAVASITGGTPLFMVSLVDDLARREMIVVEHGCARLAIGIAELAAYRPESVLQLVDMQLDRLSRDEQRVLETAAVVGAEFSTILVAAALELSVEDVDECCDGLARRQQFLRREPATQWPGEEPDTCYAFRHALVETVCLGRSSVIRQQAWHRRIAERLEAAYAADTRTVAHVLARHFDLGQAALRAVTYYLIAAEHNEARFASTDALHQAKRARELLARIPAGAERDALEMRVLGHVIQDSFRVITPMAQPLEAFERMVALARTIGDPQQLGRALVNLSYRYSTLARYADALGVLDEVDVLHAGSPLPAAVIGFAGLSRAVSLSWSGQIARAETVLVDLIDTPIPVEPTTPGILGPTNRSALLLSYLAHVEWAGRDPDRGVASALRVVAIAEQSGDPFLLGAARTHASRYRMYRGDPPDEVHAVASSVLELPDAAAWHGPGRIVAAWADATRGPIAAAEVDAIIASYHERIARFPQGATTVAQMLVMLLRAAGRDADALAVTDGALAFGRAHGELILEAALLRLRGELVEGSDPAAAEAAYLAAIACGVARGTHAFVLTASTRLAALWHGTDRHADGYARLGDALAEMAPSAMTREIRDARARLAQRETSMIHST